MKKRITSLLLALCMVLLAVPAFVLPMAAEGNAPLTTRLDLDSNWPSYTAPADPDNDPVKEYSWNGNWAIGRMYNGTFTPYSGGNRTLIATVDSASAYSNTGVYLASGAIVLTDADYGDPDSRTHAAVGYNYTVEYTSKVTVGLYQKDVEGVLKDTFKIDPASAGYEAGAYVYMAVFLNGQMVWPNKGDYATDAAKWAKVDEQSDFANSDINVKRGDQLTFAVASSGKCDRGVYFTPFVTYHEGWQVVPDAIEDKLSPLSFNWPDYKVLPGNRPLAQKDARWTIGSYNTATNTFSDYTTYTNSLGRTYAFNKSGEKPWETVGSILLGSTVNPALKGSFFLGNSTEEFAAYQVKAMATGKIKPFVENIALIDAQGLVAENATVTVKVFKNGAELTTINYDIVDKEASQPSRAFDVEKGDLITFVVTAAANEKSGDGRIAVAGTPVLECTQIETFTKAPVAAGDSAIAVDDAQLLVGSEFGLRLFAYATKDIYEDRDTEVTLNVWSSNVTGEKTDANATATVKMVYSGDFAYTADFTGFTIRELTDDFYVQVVAKKSNGDTVSSEIAAKNMVAMVTEQYQNTKDAATKELLVDMLNYAAAAQKYFNYNLDKGLANAGLTEEEKANPAKTKDEFYAQFSYANDGGDALSHSEIGGFSLILENKLSIRAYVDVSAYEQGCVITASHDLNATDLMYAEAVELDWAKTFTISNIGLDEMDKVFWMHILVEHTDEYGDPAYYFGYIISYSVESYAARMVDGDNADLANLVRAMMKFGNSVKALKA